MTAWPGERFLTPDLLRYSEKIKPVILASEPWLRDEVDTAVTDALVRVARHYRDGHRMEPWRFFRSCLLGFTLRDARRRAHPKGFRPRGRAYAERTGRAGEVPPAIVGLEETDR